MLRIKLATLGAAALLALSGTAAVAQDATPYCSKTVTDNCMQREGHAVAARHHAARKHQAARKHAAARRHAAAHRRMAAKTAPAPAPKK
ncbi:hypothetical protein [Sphingopyxis sp. A083]|jgi:hypothetical protein|uniref:hypothetical protein n=1 Tax=Sphingopyxis sp. A083 TaxID=1759083 RepID=UPI000736E5EB|nr:hypothetical protein [Sphingopyxis sp. A083]KTE75210.1 hypothetical protein ATE59_14175 [Sphingopyxis sp. A083]